MSLGYVQQLHQCKKAMLHTSKTDLPRQAKLMQGMFKICKSSHIQQHAGLIKLNPLYLHHGIFYVTCPWLCWLKTHYTCFTAEVYFLSVILCWNMSMKNGILLIRSALYMLLTHFGDKYKFYILFGYVKIPQVTVFGSIPLQYPMLLHTAWLLNQKQCSSLYTTSREYNFLSSSVVKAACLWVTQLDCTILITMHYPQN